MTKEEIKANLILKNVSLTQIADEAGCSLSQVSRCISGTGLYQNVREIIAGYLGKEVKEIFNTQRHPKPKRKTQWCRMA